MPEIKENFPLASLTTFKIGGPARFFCEAGNEKELEDAVRFANGHKLPIFVLAGGSNIIISDEGFKGLVIRLVSRDSQINILEKGEKTALECPAGENFGTLVDFARKNSLSGLEWAAGIPGTVGGAVRGNAGAYGGEIGQSVIEVRYLDLEDGAEPLKVLPREACGFSYRSSIFKEKKQLIIYMAVFGLTKGDPKEIEAKISEVLQKRKEKLPTDCSAGSFFQNPVVTDEALIKKFESDAGCSCRGGKIPAGWLIEELGLRGKKMGGVMVSEKHANFIVNTGSGKAADVVMLASFIKQQARAKLGVQLKEEVQYVGF